MTRAHTAGIRTSSCIMLHASLMTFWAVLMSAPAGATEGEDRWRYGENDERISLYIADTDLGTDAIGSPWFRCTRSSGKIQLTADMDDQEREAIAELIRKNGYPRAELDPPDRDSGYWIDVRFSEMTGWQYQFDIAADAQVFRNFVRTGVLQYKIGEFVIRAEFNVGLENAARFHSACRLPTSR